MPKVGTGSASCRRASLPAIMLMPSRPHRGRNGCCGHRHHVSKRQSITSTARCPKRHPAIPQRPASDSSISRLWSRITDSSRSGRRIARRISRTAPHWSGRRSPASRAETLDAERLYEQAIRSARANGFVHNEALAYELAARFYAARGFENFAYAYLRNARVLLSPLGRRRQGEAARSALSAVDRCRRDTVRRHHWPPGPQLDLASVVKASQAVSSEIVLPKLIERLMTIALENAGADRGLLILPAEDDHLI